MKYKCIIFDCDGVLVDSESISKTALAEEAALHGANLSSEFIEQEFVGKALKSTLIAIERDYNVVLPMDFEKRFRRRTYSKFKTDIQPMPGVVDFVKSLDIPFCVASSGPEQKIRINLKGTGLLPYFEGKIFSAYAIQKWKPDPSVFLWAAKSMGFIPEECAVIEDTVSGVRAGVTGGFDTFALSTTKNEIELNKLGAINFRTFDELEALLK
jgi:HAD superfamily hydrolase (TIGR01509 family)